MDFQNGKIVDVHAETGEEYLRSSIALDEGSAYLGEVALVPYDSPINNRGILFYNTLFDENASCHLAFGSAYPTCVRGGEKLDADGQKALGLNQSMNHVDFMVGTKDLSIVGTTQDGREIPVFVDGNFAF
jgi:aminopeptidase